MKIMPIHNNEVRIFCGDSYVDVVCWDCGDRTVFHVYAQDDFNGTIVSNDYVSFVKNKKDTKSA